MVSITYNVIDQTYCNKKSHLNSIVLCKNDQKQKTKGERSRTEHILILCSQSTEYDLRLILYVEAVGLKQTVRNGSAKQQQPQNLLNQELGTSKTADSVHGGIFCKLLAYFWYMFRHLSILGIIQN